MPNAIEFPHAVTIARNGYVSVYDPDRKVPLVVSWTTTPEGLGRVEQGFERNDAFHEDTQLPKKVPRALLSDYKGSGYARGHMVRQSERPLALDKEGNTATYGLTNILPQSRNNNAGAWAHLEDFYRDQVRFGKKTAYLQAGPIFEGPKKTIGDGVAVPSHTYKIVVLTDKGVDMKNLKVEDIGVRAWVFGVIIPNNDVDLKYGDHWAKFVVPLSEIEQRTKFAGFLSALPPEVRSAALGRKAPVTMVPKPEGTAYVVDGMYSRARAPKTSLAGLAN